MDKDQQHLYIKLKFAVSYLTTGWRRQVLTILFIFVTLFIIAQIIIANWDLFTSDDWQLQPLWIAPALVLFLIDLFISLWAWHLLVRRFTNFNNFRADVRIVLRANLARRIPGSVWYVANRAVLYQDEGVSKTDISLLSGLELALFLISGLLTTLLTLPFWKFPNRSLENLQSYWWFIFFLPIGFILIHPRVLDILWSKFSKMSPPGKITLQDTFTWLLVFIIIWAFGGGVLFSVINIFYQIPFSQLIFIIGIWSLANTISLAGFVTFSFLGLREVSLVFLLTLLVPSPIALITAIIIRLIWLSGELITSLISFRL